MTTTTPPGLARRRPGLFLLATATLGFAAGRAVRAARAGCVGDAPPDDTSAGGDVLDADALDALSARLWPGDAGDGSLSGRDHGGHPGCAVLVKR